MSTASEPSAPAPKLNEISPQLVPELKRYLGIHRDRVETMIRAGAEQNFASGPCYALALDGLLGSLFHATRASGGPRAMARPVSLAAVGSYGRQALALHSDLDVRLLCEKRPAEFTQMAEALLYPLWDAGFSVGHQVVALKDVVDLARGDLPTATSLLDWRSISGDDTLDRDLHQRAFSSVFSGSHLRDFLESLSRGATGRMERFGDSVFLLEPDLKNGAGGLRDLDIAHWAARARWQVKDLSELVRAGALSGKELEPILEARGFLIRARNLLHLHARRRSDRLGFDMQEQLANDFGYGKGGAAAEQFMSEYYRAARVIERARDVVLMRAMPAPRRRPRERALGNKLRQTGDSISIDGAAALEDDPALAFRVYAEAISRDMPVYDFARQAIVRACAAPAFCERLRNSPEARELFVRLVCTIQTTRLKQGSVLVELHDVGLLLAMIPEFLPVVGRVHHDIYHVYTVDAHSVAAVDRLRSIARGDEAAELTLASRLAAEVARPRVLFFATLLHDVGKDKGGKDHSTRGAEMAAVILERLDFSEHEVIEVQHLISRHLRMYHVATRRDIDDPRTREEFALDLRGTEGLVELYLLTVADVSTTSPTAFTSWKSRMLDELCLAMHRDLLEGPASRVRNHSSGARAAVLSRIEDQEKRAFTERFIDELPERYVQANKVDWILNHVDVAYSSVGDSARVAVLQQSDPYVELCVVMDDRPGALAMITAALSVAKLKVVGAQIYSWRTAEGVVRTLDMFWARSGMSSALAVKAAPGLERNLKRLLRGELSAEELTAGKTADMRWSTRPAPEVRARVNVDNRGATHHTIVEVITRDRRDLLFWIASSLARFGLSIELAKINTEGERVADVFYVTTSAGGKLTDESTIEALRAHLFSMLAAIEGESSQ